MRAKCRCFLCGEILTSPIFFENNIYGFSCIKKVNPNYKKQKTYFVEADSFTTEDFENGNTIINANYKNKKFSDLLVLKKYTNGDIKKVSSSIQIIENKAYINLLSYKTGIF